MLTDASSNFDSNIKGIVECVSQKLGDTLDRSTVRGLSRPAGKKHIADATIALFVDGHKSSDDIALLISNPNFSNAVAEDVDRAEEARIATSQEVGQHIVRPICQGRYEKQSYAAYRRLQPTSENKLISAIQRKMVSPKITSWLEALATDTKQTKTSEEEYVASFMQPLMAISGDTEAPKNIRSFSNTCLDYVGKARPNLFTVLEHGDFWIGNVLFEKPAFPLVSPFLGDLNVIDWGGSYDNGYPCADLVRFCSSIYRKKSSDVDRFILRYTTSLNISNFEMGVYCMLSLGKLRMNLELFPKDRYYFKCQKVIKFLDTYKLIETP